MKKKSVFFVTTIDLNLKNNLPINDRRTVGWFQSFKLADICVTRNYGDIWEGNYNYAVIEELEWGLYPHPLSEQWYKFNKEKQEYEKTEKPEQFKNIVNFSIG
jgi:hypothetical protein